MNFTSISTSLMHFALCLAMLTVFLVASECTASDPDAQPVVTAPTAASVPDGASGAVPGVVPGKKLSNPDGHDGDDDDHDDDDNDEDKGHDDQGKKKKPGVGSNDPGGAGTGGHAASPKAGVFAARIPDAGTDNRPDGSGVPPVDGRTGAPLSSPSSPDHSNGSGGGGSGSGSVGGSTSTPTAGPPPLPPPPPSGGGSGGEKSGSGGENTGGLPSGTVVGGTTVTGGSSVGGSTVGGIGITSTGSKINSTTTTKMVDDDKPKQDAIETSTAPITPLINPTKTVQRQQPVEKKNDGSSRKAFLSAFPTLLMLTVMSFVPMY